MRSYQHKGKQTGDCYPLKRVKSIGNISTFDVETKKGTWNKFDFIGLCHKGKYQVFYSIEDFLDCILTPDNANKYTFFAHNLDFDGMFILDVLMDSPDYHIFPIMAQRTLGYDIKKGGNVWKIRDSYAILPHKLKKLMADFKTIHQKESLENIFARNEGDCVALKEILEKHFSDNLFDVGGISASNINMTIFRSKFLKRPISDNKRFDDSIRAGYYGGRTEIFKFNHDVDSTHYIYDINSLYPSVMLGNNYPLGRLKRFPVKMLDDIEGLAYVRIESDGDFPLIPVHDRKLIFRKGVVFGWYCLPYIRMARDMGYPVDIIKLYGTTDYGMIFDDYVNFWYDRKRKSKESSRSMYEASKLAMNGLYGKFAQKTKRSSIIINPSELPRTYQPLTGDEKVIRVEYESQSGFIKPILSAYVTSYATCKMQTYLNSLEKDIVWNMDTDSLFLSEKKLENSAELGKMSLENEVRGFMPLLPKIYIHSKGVKSKGVDLYDEIDGQKIPSKEKIMAYFSGGKVEYVRGIMKFRSSIRKGRGVFERQISKSVKSPYDKRKMDGCDTFPIDRYNPKINAKTWEGVQKNIVRNLPDLLEQYF